MQMLTVGVPVHNGMPYLRECIDSLLTQSYQDFEILVIDDGSTDDSLKYLESVKSRRLRILFQPRRGLSFTLNRMLREATTPWLVRQDADDISFPHRMQLAVDHIQKYPDAGMFYSYAQYYGNGRTMGRFRTTKASSEELRTVTQSGYLLAICHPTVILNVKKTLALGGYRFDLHIEDIDLWWRMALNHEIRLIAETTVGFRLNEESVSTRNLEAQSLNTLYVQYLLLSHLWGLPPLNYESVSWKMAALVDVRKLRFRRRVRLSRIKLANQEYLSAFYHGLNALVRFPAHLFARLACEIKSPMVVNGVDPLRFARRQDLWSEEPNCDPELGSCFSHKLDRTTLAS